MNTGAQDPNWQPQNDKAIVMRSYVSQLFTAVTKTPDSNNLKEQRFVLAHSLTGFNPWLAGPNHGLGFKEAEHHGGRLWKAAQLMAARKKEGRERALEESTPGMRNTLAGNPSSDLLPPTRSHLLQFLVHSNY